MNGTPPDALNLTSKLWTSDEIHKAYQIAQKSPTDVSKHLPPKQRRRYIVVGGSGLVGGWIVQHLLMRGEDSEAIRLLDLREPTQSLILKSKVQFTKTDVSLVKSVNAAFNAQWASSHVSDLGLTVFHTVGYINPSERKEDFMSIYQAVNINGTRHVLETAKKIGATCLVATASGSIGVDPPSFSTSILTRWHTKIFQVLSKPNLFDAKLPLSAYGSCYAYSKALAESFVQSADYSRRQAVFGLAMPFMAQELAMSLRSPWLDYFLRSFFGALKTWISLLSMKIVSLPAYPKSISFREIQLFVYKNIRVGI